MKKWDLYEQRKNGDESISVEDLISDYAKNYCPLVFNEEVAPIVERMKKAKSDYFNALMDLHEKEEEYKDIYNEINEYAHRFKVDGAYLLVNNPAECDKKAIEQAMIDEKDLYKARINELPDGIERVVKDDE
ncbi:hypothetical protein [Fervidibacillus halotolerans]|uniref:Uncharacterized protein n=1 Tax=Fervidibacillus halotolerans TaxID=2980027 RepID=A0A9E8M1Y0_9BACI|nr:hypothetical protein [Fervidibacillus halotolerans]WAA13400.1 hypothetical protein OE105_04615 [Fervidibacillus halotolerans]